VSWLKSSVLTRASLTVVPVTNDNPLDSIGLVVTGSGRNRAVFTSPEVPNLVGLAVLSVDGTDQHVVRDVVEVSTVLQPRTSHGNVVSSGLALALDQDRDAQSILSIPGLESLKDLQAVAGGGDLNSDRLPVLRRSLVGVTARVVSISRETVTRWRRELELLAILVLQGVGERVELEGTSDGHGNNNVRGGNESMGGRVGIVTASEVTVVGRDDGVGLALLHVPTVPLSDARTASVGKDHRTELLKGLQLAITLNGSTDLLRTRSDSEQRLGLEAVVQGITGDGGGTGHVLIRGVGARTNQTDLELFRPLVGFNGLLELGDGGGQVRGERTVDVRLELGQVDLDELVVLGTLVFTELLGVRASEVTDMLALGGLQVVVHAVVEGEDRSGGTDFSTHVADGTHTSARQRLNARTVVFDDGTSASLDGKDTSDLQDNI